MIAAEEQTFQNITVDTAYQMIKKENKYPNLMILDVRTPCEYDMGHLPTMNLKLVLGDSKSVRILITPKVKYDNQKLGSIFVASR